jgi:hypothetical protein
MGWKYAAAISMPRAKWFMLHMDAKYSVNNVCTVCSVVQSDRLFDVRIDPNSLCLCRAGERDFNQFFGEVHRSDFDVQCRVSL